MAAVRTAAWALYNLIRYFMAFNVYTSNTGQAVSLALGTSATLSLAFLMSAALISVFRQYLLLHNFPLHSLLVARTILQWLLSFFLLAPAVVSFALVFAWKNSADSELRIRGRCFADIDAVWSVSKAQCRQPSHWATWVVLSLLRLILTLVDLVSTFISSFLCV